LDKGFSKGFKKKEIIDVSIGTGAAPQEAIFFRILQGWASRLKLFCG